MAEEPAADATRAGVVIGERYELERELGRGGAAIVWRARDLRENRIVALKLLHPHLRFVDRARDHFAQEAEVIGELRHPGIVRALDWKLDGERPYIVMEYREGQRLDQAVRAHAEDGAHFASEEVARTIRDLVSALEHAHGRGVVHRDLKPSNIMLAPRGAACILDFGVARLITSSDQTTVGRVVGTYAYMSPEQAAGERVDQRSDIFSLGIIVHEMLTLERAWMADVGQVAELVRRIVEGPRPRPSAARKELDPRFDAIVARATAVDPRERPASAIEMWRELEPLLLAPRVRVRSTRGASTRCRAWTKRSAIAAIAGALALVAALVAAVVVAVDERRGRTIEPARSIDPTPPAAPPRAIATLPETPQPAPAAPVASATIAAASQVEKKPARPPPARPPVPAAAEDPLQPTRALIAAAEARPEETERFRAAAAALRTALASLDDPTARARQLRILEVAELSYDLAALRKVFQHLEANR